MTALLTPLSRIPSADKLVDSQLLNRAGLQVARMLAARAIYRARRVHVDPSVAEGVQELWRTGILVLTDFLPPGDFAAVRAECDRIEARGEKMRPSQWGPNSLTSAWIHQLAPADVRAIRSCLDHPRLRAIATAAERRVLPPLSDHAEVEWLEQGVAAGVEDAQTIWHSDTFFNTHKVWFYLDDVGLGEGPLAYIHESHRLTSARLRFAYEHSWKRDPAADPSRRIAAEELDRCGGEESVIACRGNTLVIANTCGYHRRLQGQPGRRRRALHVTLRANPFIPPAFRARRAASA